MRVSLLLALLIPLGALTMSDAATADEPKKEKKEEKKGPLKIDKEEDCGLKVSVRQKAGAIFVNPLETVAARTVIEGKDNLYVWTLNTSIKPLKGTEITDPDGVVWVVAKTYPHTSYYRCEVEKKPAEKKEEKKP